MVRTKTFALLLSWLTDPDNAGRVFPSVRSVAIPAIVVVVVIDGLLSKPIYHFVIDVLHTWKNVVLNPTPHFLHF